MSGETVESRFWAKVDKTNDCWIWTAAIELRHSWFTHNDLDRGARQ